MHSSLDNDIGRTSLDETFAAAEQEEKLPADQREVLESLKKSIKQLKSIMLTLEWDLSFKALQQLDDEIAAQEETWQADKNVAGLLRILRALGKYIMRMQANTHPVAIKLFFAVYNGLEKIILSPDMQPGKKKNIVLLAYQRYNEVKRKLDKRNKLQKKKQSSLTDADDVESSAADKGSPAEDETMEEQGDFLPALSDISASDDDVQRRSSWYEKEEPAELGGRLEAFFIEDETEEVGAGGEDQHGEQQNEPQAQQEDGNIIESLFSAREEGEADQLLADIHMSVFDQKKEESASDGNASSTDEQQDMAEAENEASPQEIPDTPTSSSKSSDEAKEDLEPEEETPAAVGLHEDSEGPLTEDSDQSDISADISKKLDSFFDETEDNGQAEDVNEAAPEDPSGNSAPESYDSGDAAENADAAAIEGKLDAFFDEEAEESSFGGEISEPLSENEGKSEEAGGLGWLLGTLNEVTDDYKYPPAAEEKQVLEERFSTVEDKFKDDVFVNTPLILLRSALISSQEAQENLSTPYLQCAARTHDYLSKMAGQDDAGNGSDAAVFELFKEFLALKERQIDLLRRTEEAEPVEGPKGDKSDNSAQQRKKKKKGGSKAKQIEGDILVEDFLTDDP